MTDEELALVRASYKELRGYLSEAPPLRTWRGTELADNLAHVIGDLSAVTGNDYSRFRVSVERGQLGPYTNGEAYRSRLAGLVGRLEAEFGLSDDRASNGGSPGVRVELNQTLQQITEVTLNLEIQQWIDAKTGAHPEGTPERMFLDRLRGSLANVKDVAGLVAAIVGTANTVGLKVEDLMKLFGVH